MDSKRLPGVNDTFRCKRVLVIGSTGFLGKLLVERLLRTVPDIGAITLLVRRNKRGQDATLRIDEEILDTPLLARLRADIGTAEYNRRVGRLVGVTGDITEPMLGLDAGSYRQLARSTDLIMNSAASVDFREELDRALATNTDAVDRLLDLAADKTVPILHVSTCYVSSFARGLIREADHAPPGAGRPDGPASPGTDRRALFTDALVRHLRTSVADTSAAHRTDSRARAEAMVELGQAKARQHGWNDCYTMTKWLAEQRLLARRSRGPLTILRPSIIESTCRQPLGGWLEGIKVADAVVYAYAKRGLSVFPARKDRIIDVIPADVVANSVVLAGAELLSAPPGARIYQCCSGSTNPLRIGELRDYVVNVARRRSASFPRLFVREPKRKLRLVPPVLYHSLAAVAGLVLKALSRVVRRGGGIEERARRFRKLSDLIELYAFYASPDYVFCNRRLRRLHGAFPTTDRLQLPVDVTELNWQHYIEHVHIPGLHRYVLTNGHRRPTKQRQPSAVPAEAVS